jgi:peptidoglycan/xylan/chitin deacetylase (PgdA/CDA1 family)
MNKLLALLHFLQCHRLFAYLNRKKVTILMYHGFTDETSHAGLMNYHGKHLFVGRFRQQIAYLKRHYTIISLDHLVEAQAGKRELPDRAVILTFDDGYKSNHSLAYPVLKEFAAPATIFITGNFVDKREFLWPDRVEYALDKTSVSSFDLTVNNEIIHFDIPDRESKKACNHRINGLMKAVPQDARENILQEIEEKLGHTLSACSNVHDMYLPLDWADVQEMIGSGLVSFGSHSISHGIISRYSPERMREELLFPKQVIEEKTGVPCTLFAYPNGAPGDFSAESRRLLIDLGYTCGLTTVKGSNDSKADIYELKRVGIRNSMDIAEFVMAISGATRFLLKLKNRQRD